MHDYGIKASALAGLNIYEQASRGSGRTHQMIQALKGGETVVAWGSAEYMRRMIRDIREPDLKINIVVIQRAADLERACEAAMRRRATIVLDHTVILQIYLAELEMATRRLERYGARPHPFGEATNRPPPVGERFGEMLNDIRGMRPDRFRKTFED